MTNVLLKQKNSAVSLFLIDFNKFLENRRKEKLYLLEALPSPR
jgi:hypothetical protein